NPEIRTNSLNHQERQVQSTSDQFSTLTHSNIEIESDSNIIPYSQCLNESQSNTVKNLTLRALQDDIILSVIEQLKTKLLPAQRSIRTINSVIGKTDVIVVPDSKNTLMHAEESRSKMIAKQNDPQLVEKKVITKPIDYATLNQLSTDFNTRFVPQTESYAEQAFWYQYSVQTDEPTHSGTTIVEVPKELPKVSMVNSCLKKLKFHLASFDIVLKEQTTATAITEGTRG
nr:hypothetical protein [Tanacetum cinerariifolium]